MIKISVIIESGAAPAEVLVDLRSDTVTRPTPGMLQYMMQCAVGDDVFDDDPTVSVLQDKVAKMCGKEAALFMVTGTMTNQIGIRALLLMKPHIVYPEVLLHAIAHTYRINKDECGGIAVNSRAQPFPIFAPREWLTAELVESNLHLESNLHAPRTALISLRLCAFWYVVNGLALEVPCAGVVMPLEEIEKISAIAKKNNLFMHLDGARLWNACVATGIPISKYCSLFDSISLCLSKGSPIGSVLVGSKQQIEYARELRKGFGGGWRQAGLLAACGIYAIDHQWARMKEDHENCRFLAEGLKKLGFKLVNEPETNILRVDSKSLGVEMHWVREEMKKRKVLMLGSGYSARFVTHIQATREKLEYFLKQMEEVLASRP